MRAMLAAPVAAVLLTGAPTGVACGEPPLGEVTVDVRAEASGRAISPLVYGVAAADPATLRALGATVNRWGGNATTRYNWTLGRASNAGRDWGFRNVTLAASADTGVADTLAAGAVPLLTVPTIGWVAKNGDNATASVGVPAPGAAGYDPAANRLRTSVPSLARRPGPADAVYQDEWIQHLASRFGGGPQGVQLLAMDNEPDLWSTTHTDVHPARMGYDDMLANFREYAGAVKARDPAALVLGPDVSGWTGYLYSDLDRGGDNFATHADRRAHGDQDFLPWWLGQVHRLDQASGTRSLDYLDVHYYPQASGVALSDRADGDTRAVRLRSVRSLWDPGYRDESWIRTQVMLIPRLRRWIDQQYPGTRLAITEYSWGGQADASGAVALAEVLGVFGREGVDLATYWTYPPPASPAGAAFRLYRNADGRGAAFGDRSLPATSSRSPVAAFASRHSDSGEIDVVVADESQSSQATVSLRGIAGSGYQAGRYCVPPGSGRIERAGMTGAGAAFPLPPLGLCLVRLQPMEAGR